MADEGTFMHMAVDNVKAATQHDFQPGPGQENVKGDFVQRGADLVIGTPGRGPGAHDLQVGQVPPQVVGDDRHLVAQSLKRPRLLQDAYVAAIVGEEGGGSDHQNTICVGQGTYPGRGC